MSRRSHPFLTLAAIALWLSPCWAGGLPAQPDTVTFTGREARITVSQRLAPERAGQAYRLVVHLPAGTMRESLTMTVDGKPAEAFMWVEKASPSADPPPAALSTSEKDPQRKRLLADLESLTEKGAGLEAAHRSLRLRMQHWESVAGIGNGAPSDAKPSQPDARPPSSADAARVDDLLAERVPAIAAALRTGQAAIEENTHLVEAAKRALHTFDAARSGETVHVPARSQETVQVRYAYSVPARAQLHYHVNARPGQGTLEIVSLADLHQSTGFDWQGADVTLALADRLPRLSPAAPPPWIIDYAEKTPPAPESGIKPESIRAMRSVNSPRPSMELREPSQGPAAVQHETGRTWKLGRHDLANDTPLTVQLAGNSHPATFAYTLRPRQQRRAYLRAAVTFAHPEELPTGRADCFVDGDFVGAQQLALTGTKATVFLGTDPLVTATIQDMDSKRGEHGLLAKSQTRSWNWRIAVENRRNRAVDVRVEEAAPIVRDSSIQLKSVADPTPTEALPTENAAHPSLRYLVWERRVEPQGTFVITWRVDIDASAEKTLSPGR